MSDEQTTPPTPDAGVSESVRTLQRIRETCADVEAWQVWSADGALLEAYPGELLDHIATLTAQLAAANEAFDTVMSVAPVYCEHLHHTKKEYHKSGEPCPVEARIKAIDAARTGAR